MGRLKKDLTIENLVKKLLKRIDTEENPARLSDLLVCYIKANEILEKREAKKADKQKAKLAMPKS